MDRRSVTIQVPATTSNLGPGFDTLGIALNLHCRVAVTRRPGPHIRLLSPIDESAREGAQSTLEAAAALFFKFAGGKAFGADVFIEGEIPIARGLGSSVGVRLGLAAGLNELAGQPLPRPTLLNLVTELEHHPDNAAPAVYGGFAIAAQLADGVHCLHFKVPRHLCFVTLIPNFEINTERARALLPDHYSREDAVHNLSRAALLAAALATKNLGELRGLFQDRFHQPYRQPLIPPLARVIAAGEGAGALGGWLSGSGSTIICLTLQDPARVARAMQSKLPDSAVKVLRADNAGFKAVNPTRAVGL